MADLSTVIGGIRMKNPVMVASGTFGYGVEYAEVVNLNELGALVVKGVNRDGWPGNPTPRTEEVAMGLINSIGLQNPGVDEFLRGYLPQLRAYAVPVIVNIWGRDIAEYVAVAERLDQAPGVAGLEVNVSCPNIKEGRGTFGSQLDLFRELLDALRPKTRLPLIPKLAPDFSLITRFAKAAEECGADAVSLINTLPAMAIDAYTRRPILGNKVGGLSGPGIKPVALRMVWEVARTVRIPIIGMGGIGTEEDAIEFLLAGASAVAVGTANFANPCAALEIAAGLKTYLDQQGFASVRELVGQLKT